VPVGPIGPESKSISLAATAYCCVSTSKTIVSGVSLSRIAAAGSSDIAWETDKVKSAAKIKVINVQPPARFL
jgi:hypothetical protein